MPRKKVTISITDPDRGLFHKGVHKEFFVYGVQTACDAMTNALGVSVHSDNIHDSVALDSTYKLVTERFQQIKIVTIDARYKTPWICKTILDDGRFPSMPYKRPMTKKGNHEWWKYVCDEYCDCVICPEYQVLKYSTTIDKDTGNTKSVQRYVSIAQRVIFAPTAETVKRLSHSTFSEALLSRQKIFGTHRWESKHTNSEKTIEQVFADTKDKHGMRYTPNRGLTTVTK